MKEYNYQLFVKTKDSYDYKGFNTTFTSLQISQLIYYFTKNFPKTEFIIKYGHYHTFTDIETMEEWEIYDREKNREDFI